MLLHGDEQAVPIARHSFGDRAVRSRSDLSGASAGERAADIAFVIPGDDDRRLEERTCRSRMCERRDRHSHRRVLEPILFVRAVPGPVHDGCIDLAPFVRQRKQSGNAEIGGRKKSGMLHPTLLVEPRPETLRLIDDDILHRADASKETRAGTESVAQPGVLEVGVLEAERPTLVEGVRRGVRVLEDVRRDADLGVVAGRHPEGQIGAVDVELIGGLTAKTRSGRRVGSDVVAAEHQTREID